LIVNVHLSTYVVNIRVSCSCWVSTALHSYSDTLSGCGVESVVLLFTGSGDVSLFIDFVQTQWGQLTYLFFPSLFWKTSGDALTVSVLKLLYRPVVIAIFFFFRTFYTI
jgi:hypothetical protein